jgi:hypothetical protein
VASRAPLFESSKRNTMLTIKDDTYSTSVANFKPLAKYFQQRATVGVAFTF